MACQHDDVVDGNQILHGNPCKNIWIYIFFSRLTKQENYSGQLLLPGKVFRFDRPENLHCFRRAGRVSCCVTNAPRGFVVFLPVTRTIRSLCLRSLLVIVRIMCQGNYDLDSDDDCVIDIPFNGDLMISQQHNLQEEDEGFFGILFNEDWLNWRQC